MTLKVSWEIPASDVLTFSEVVCSFCRGVNTGSMCYRVFSAWAPLQKMFLDNVL